MLFTTPQFPFFSSPHRSWSKILDLIVILLSLYHRVTLFITFLTRIFKRFFVPLYCTSRNVTAALSIDTFYISPDQGSAEQPGRLLKVRQSLITISPIVWSSDLLYLRIYLYLNNCPNVNICVCVCHYWTVESAAAWQQHTSSVHSKSRASDNVWNEVSSAPSPPPRTQLSILSARLYCTLPYSIWIDSIQLLSHFNFLPLPLPSLTLFFYLLVMSCSFHFLQSCPHFSSLLLCFIIFFSLCFLSLYAFCLSVFLSVDRTWTCIDSS